MSYGFKVINSTNYIQVDDTFVCARMVASGTAPSKGALGISGTKPTINFPSGMSGVPLVFVKPASLNGFVGGYQDFGTKFAYWCNVSFSYRIFTVSGTPIQDASTYGLQVKNSSGVEVFSTKLTYPRVQNVFLGSLSSSTSFAYDKNYAVSNSTGTIPWFLLNPFMQSWHTYDEYDECLSAVCGGFTSNTNLRVSMYDIINGRSLLSHPFVTTTARRQIYDPYHSGKGATAPQFIVGI